MLSPAAGCRCAALAAGAGWIAASSCPTTPTGPGCIEAIHATGAERIYATHGSIGALTHYLARAGSTRAGFKTEYGDEEVESGPSEEAAT